MTNKLRSTERNPGAEMMERLFTESFQNSSRPPFRGTINVDKQALDLLDYANQFFFCGDYSTLNMLFVSPNAVNVMGYEPEEFNFSTVFEMIHPDDRRAVFEIAKKVLGSEMSYISGDSHCPVVLYLAYRAAKKNGRYTRISLTISRHTDPVGGIYDMGVIRDISHIRCGTRVTFALLGGRTLKELPDLSEKDLSISRREQEIIYYISQGYTSSRIAYELNISKFTVNTHRRNIMRKTGTKNLVDLLIYASNNGII